MQRLTRQHLETILHKLPVPCKSGTLHNVVAAVGAIVEERMPDVLHVGTYLMRAPCLQHTLHQRHVSEPLQHLPVRHRMLPPLFLLGHTLLVRIDTHHPPVLRRTAQVAHNGAAVFVKIAPHKGVVFSLDCMFKELLGQKRLCLLVLGHQQQARRILVDAVHQVGFCLFPTPGLHALEVIQQAVDQRPRPVAHARMHHQAGLFLHHQHILVLIHNVDIQRLRQQFELMGRLRQQHTDLVQRFHTVVGLHSLAVDHNTLGLVRRLYLGTRHPLQVHLQVLVNAQHRLPTVHHQVVMLVEFLLLIVEFEFFCHQCLIISFFVPTAISPSTQRTT